MLIPLNLPGVPGAPKKTIWTCLSFLDMRYTLDQDSKLVADDKKKVKSIKTLLVVWLGQFVCELFPNGDLWGIGHPDEAVSEAQIHRWEPRLCPPCKVAKPL